jgi:uncharacterized protein
MLKLLPAGVYLALAVPCLIAQQASFDCAKAATPQEKTICASPELRKADATMGAAYNAWLNAAPSAQWKDSIRANQRFWIKQSISACQDNTNSNMNKCLMSAEVERTQDLNKMIEHDNGVLFVWRPVNYTAQDSEEIRADRIKDGQPDYGYVNVTWPEALSTAPGWAAWNKAIADAARDLSRPEDTKPGTAWAKNWAIDQDVETGVSFNSVTANLISVDILGSVYSHGAPHPNGSSVELNWLLKEQRKLKPTDIFQPQSNWQSKLYTRTDKYLHSQIDADSKTNYQDMLGKPEKMVKTVNRILDDPANWQIDSRGITIVFNQYAVASYAQTPLPFTMSWQSLKPLLQPGFVPPSANSKT